MNLHDPNRPKTLNSLPAWTRGHFAIKPPTLIAQRDHHHKNPQIIFFLSIWLPIDDKFSCMEFKKKINISDLGQILLNFTENPENFTEETFTNDFGFTPQLRNKTKLNLDEYQNEVPSTTPTKRPYSRTRYRAKPFLSNLQL